MRKLYFLFLFLQFIFSNGQTFNSKELIKIWSISDKTQTIEAEKTYDDLRLKFNSDKYNQILKELNAHIKSKPNQRLAIRIGIYDVLGFNSVKDPHSVAKEDKIQGLFEMAMTLKDEQLLSEVYSLYAEQGPGNVEDKLFYNTSAVEIQQRIGAQYFPRLYLRFLSLSSGYFSLDDYEESIAYGYKCLDLLNKNKPDIYAYSLQYDILGYSYYELNQPDSGIYYYQKIKNILEDKRFSIANYKPIYIDEHQLKLIWHGVADGGIARGLITKGKYDEAISLLEKNIISSTKFDQKVDLAKAKNLLAKAYAQKGEFSKAINLWHEGFEIASQFGNPNRYLIAATNGLSETYKSMHRYDSAYHYVQLKQNFEKSRNKEINQSRLHSVNARLQFEKLDSQIKAAEQTIVEQNSNRNLILAGSFGAIFILLFVYSKYRFEQKIKFKNLELKQKIAQIDKQRVEEELNVARQSIKVFIDKVNEKNVLIEEISDKLNELNAIHSHEKKELENTLEELRNTKIITDDDWRDFQNGFDRVYIDFTKILLNNFPSITPSEQRYLMLTKIGMNHKEMARALGISSDSVRVTWNRVRNKMGGTLEDTPQTLLEKCLENSYS